jgi:uncharacterized protein involved in exopolysaccharide biosynthesis
VNLRKVVQGTDLANTVSSERDIADRVAGLQKAITITAQQDNLFEIAVKIGNGGSSDAQNAKLARAVAQKLIDIFVEDNLADKREASSQSLLFLDQQLAARQRQLQEAEAKRAEFQAQYLGALPGNGPIEDRLAAARAQLAQIESGQRPDGGHARDCRGCRRRRGAKRRARTRAPCSDPGPARRRTGAGLYRAAP